MFKSLKVKYIQNGFMIYYTYDDKNDNKIYSKFIPYQAITMIGEIKHSTLGEKYDILLGKYCGELIYSFYSFDIYLNNNDKISLSIINDRKSFPRLGKNYNKLSFLKKFFFEFLSDNGISKETKKWMKNEENIKDTYKNISNFRNELIKHFSEWKHK